MGPLLRPRRRLLSLAAGATMATDRCQSHPPAPSRSPLPPHTDTLAELERLARLHESGGLSDEEFTDAKARVLGVQR